MRKKSLFVLILILVLNCLMYKSNAGLSNADDTEIRLYGILKIDEEQRITLSSDRFASPGKIRLLAAAESLEDYLHKCYGLYLNLRNPEEKFYAAVDGSFIYGNLQGEPQFRFTWVAWLPEEQYLKGR